MIEYHLCLVDACSIGEGPYSGNAVGPFVDGVVGDAAAMATEST